MVYDVLFNFTISTKLQLVCIIVSNYYRDSIFYFDISIRYHLMISDTDIVKFILRFFCNDVYVPLPLFRGRAERGLLSYGVTSYRTRGLINDIK